MSTPRQRWEVPGITASRNHSYFHVPPAWIGTKPTAQELASAGQLVKVVSTRTLDNGTVITIHRDGVVQFDTSNWPDATPINIPPYTAEHNHPIPATIAAQQRIATQHLYQCTTLMNSHLACISTALSKIQHLGVGVHHRTIPRTTHTSAGRSIGGPSVSLRGAFDELTGSCQPSVGRGWGIFQLAKW